MQPAIQEEKDNRTHLRVPFSTPWFGTIECLSIPSTTPSSTPATTPNARIHVSDISMGGIRFECSEKLPFLTETLPTLFRVQVTNAAIRVKEQKSYTWHIQLAWSQDIRKTPQHPTKYAYGAKICFDNHTSFSLHYQLLNQLLIQQQRKEQMINPAIWQEKKPGLIGFYNPLYKA